MDYFTNQNIVDFVEREYQQRKNSDGYISFDNCRMYRIKLNQSNVFFSSVSIIKEVLPDFSETRITDILSDHDVQG